MRVKFFWLIAGFLLMGQGYGQNPENFIDISGVVEYQAEPLNNVVITVTSGAAKVHTIYTKEDGEFQFKLDYNREYTMELSKKGMVTKKIVINTQMPPNLKGGWGAGFPVDLYPFCKGIDLSVFNDPITIIRFDQKKKEFEGDEEYFEKMRTRIENFLMANEDCLDKEYQNQLKSADQLLREKKI